MLAELTELFRAAGFEQPSYEARQVLQSAPDEKTAKDWTLKRLTGIPLAYLTGKKGFYKSEFFVEAGVLIPRPETEHIIEEALRRVANSGRSIKHLADLGCGSGCVGLSLLLEWPTAQLTSVDQSAKAIEVTAKNRQNLKLSYRGNEVLSSVEDYIPDSKFDLVVANPPYIAEHDPNVQPSVVQFEPAAALYSGADGLQAITAWTKWSAKHLVQGGLWIFEIGAGQSSEVLDIIEQAGFVNPVVVKDLAGFDRVISSELGSASEGDQNG